MQHNTALHAMQHNATQHSTLQHNTALHATQHNSAFPCSLTLPSQNTLHKLHTTQLSTTGLGLRRRLSPPGGAECGCCVVLCYLTQQRCFGRAAAGKKGASGALWWLQPGAAACAK
uniref:Uncharacterized protein n=1 Tax=Terrapene triunguis TaxID=2587831 RepID=A0A674K626_9SAUR